MRNIEAMQVSLTRRFRFEAAHWLPCFPEGHKCRRLHGHSFHVEVELRGEVPPERGYLIDFGQVKAAIDPIEERLDHRLLNEIEGLHNPSAEVLARWIYDQLKPALPILVSVRLEETCNNAVIYRGPEGQ